MGGLKVVIREKTGYLLTITSLSPRVQLTLREVHLSGDKEQDSARMARRYLEEETENWPGAGETLRLPVPSAGDRVTQRHRKRGSRCLPASVSRARSAALGDSQTHRSPACLSKPAFRGRVRGRSPWSPSCRLRSSFPAAQPGASLPACKMGSKSRHVGLLLPPPQSLRSRGIPSVGPREGPEVRTGFEFTLTTPKNLSLLHPAAVLWALMSQALGTYSKALERRSDLLETPLRQAESDSSPHV